MTMDSSDKIYYNRLYRIWSVIAFGAGTRMLAELTERYENSEEMYGAFKSKDASLPSEAVRAASGVSLSAAEKVIEICEKKKINITSIDEENYPNRLRSIYAPPSVLFYKGDISGTDGRLSIGIVGARKASDYSLKVASGIVRVLGKQGFDIISGFAEGIDICAHINAVKCGAKTYAVLGAGTDYDYPKNNFKYRELIAENGALISEYIPGTRPDFHNFPNRNRILAGLSMTVAVIEAGAKSGSLNSASHCISQGKTVFAVPPGDIFDPAYRGNTELIREGAVPLMGARDIINEYCTILQHTIVENPVISEKLEALKKFAEAAFEADKAQCGENKKSKRTSPKKSDSTGKPLHETENESFSHSNDTPVTLSAEKIESSSADPLQKNILEKINITPMRADDISREISENIDDVLAALTELEIMGTVIAENGVYRIG